MNIVGVPYREVHSSSAIAFTLAAASKEAAGRTIVPPWITAFRLPMTQPRQ